MGGIVKELDTLGSNPAISKKKSATRRSTLLPFKKDKYYEYKMIWFRAILMLQENGVLHKLKTKWWKQKGALNCEVSSFSTIMYTDPDRIIWVSGS
jgi:hypothetical protein